MDTTTTSTAGGTDDSVFRTNYVSCIKVDGQPILPPVMTEKRREEMKHYRELALIKEKELQDRRKTYASNSAKPKLGTTFTSNESLFEKQQSVACDLKTLKLPNNNVNRSPSTSPIPGVPATSTPRVHRMSSVQTAIIAGQQWPEKLNQDIVSPVVSPTLADSSDVPRGVLCERKIVIPPLDLNTSTSTAPSGDGNPTSSYDGDEEKGDADPSESDDQRSEENFASAASSTGTFVIRRSSENKPLFRQTDVVDNYVSTSDEEENAKEAPPTVVRKPDGDDPIFKRKRPAKYFDVEEEETDKSRGSTFSNIPNVVPENNQTPTEDYKSVLTSNSPGTTTKTFSPNPVPITNFSSLAKSLTIEFTKKFCSGAAAESLFTTPVTKTSKGKSKLSGGTYDVRLSTEIPSSAEKVKEAEEDALSNSSDKENIDSNDSTKNHVRKLSYTLATPSAALLEAVSKDKFFTQTLETVPSAPSSVGVQSAYQTPEKSNIKEIIKNKGNLSSPSDKNNGNQIALTNKGVSTLGHAKQAHLERFLGEQEQLSQRVVSEVSPPSARGFEDMQQIFLKMQEKHETQLHRLAEQHRLQELRIRSDFESELEKLKEKFSATLNTTDSSKSFKASPNSLADSVNNSARSPRLDTLYETRSINFTTSEEPTSNTTNFDKLTTNTTDMSITSHSQLPSNKNTSIYHFTGGNSTAGGDVQSSSATVHTNHTNAGGTTMELAVVGLSKLHSRMQLMSPKLFRTPADARSPLLKGLVFPDPLDKPHIPLRIPQKALEAHMKPKFNRVSAAVKGYLTRRLLTTEKVQIIVNTIRDTVDLLLKLYEEAPATGGVPCVRTQDNELYQRLIQQLTGACRSFHDVFFKLSIKERMAIVATDREKLRTKALRSLASPAKPSMSNATLKSIERRMSHRSSPKKDNRKSRSSKVCDQFYGSQSVKPKPIKTYFNISPKRRRISYWDERNNVSRSTPALAGKQDFNGNNFKASSAKAPVSSRSGTGLGRSTQLPGGVGGGMGETFIVPPAVQSSRTTLGLSNSRRLQVGSSAASASQKSTSARSTQSTVSTISGSSSGANRSRASLSRHPWNSSRS